MDGFLCAWGVTPDACETHASLGALKYSVPGSSPHGSGLFEINQSCESCCAMVGRRLSYLSRSDLPLSAGSPRLRQLLLDGIAGLNTTGTGYANSGLRIGTTMAKKNRPSVLKREREQKKRDRDIKKSQKAAVKRARRENKSGEPGEGPAMGDVPATPISTGPPVDVRN